MCQSIGGSVTEMYEHADGDVAGHERERAIETLAGDRYVWAQLFEVEVFRRREGWC